MKPTAGGGVNKHQQYNQESGQLSAQTLLAHSHKGSLKVQCHYSTQAAVFNKNLSSDKSAAYNLPSTKQDSHLETNLACEGGTA